MRPLLLIAVVALLQACSGGSGGGGTDRSGSAQRGNDFGDGSQFVYSGPVPANSEIQHFKTAFYDNVVIRCGGCHTNGGNGPTAFVDNDDVNLAWEEAGTVANLMDPGASELVTRLENGHNCWLNSNASCAAAMTSYIERWAEGASQSMSSVTLTPRSPRAMEGLKIAPTTYAQANAEIGFSLTASPELLYLLNTHCAECHTGSSATPQSPYFASDDPAIAYSAMLGKIDLASPANSRLVVRLENQHNCWSGIAGCDDDAVAMRNAIQRFADELDEVTVDPGLVTSAAQILEEDGIVASSGGRFEDDVIAKWEFREGEGTQVADTSGVQPEIPLTVLGDFEWFGAWGIRLDDGRIQGPVNASGKLHQRLTATGEYTIEAWVTPNNVTQEDAWIFGYAAGPDDRNTLLTQTLYNYDFYNRSSANPESDGGPATSTDDDDEFAQASLQHVVLTYDPFNGRKIYVNGQDTAVIDAEGPGNLADWNSNYAVVMGNDFAGSSPWQGVVRMVAVHSRALTQSQIVQNYDVGVGQKYYMMFSVSSILDREGVCHSVDAENNRTDYCYIVFEVSQFDGTSYLFREPRFININPESDSQTVNFDLRGIYLGMNGQLARTGQGFVNIDATINGSDFTMDDAPLQTTGTIVPLENGPEDDVFFLAFEEIDGEVDATSDPGVGTFDYSYPPETEKVQIGMRIFDEINESFSHVTGVPKDDGAVSPTYDRVRRSLPSVSDFQTYMASHQMAVMQLAAAYCGALVEDTSLRDAFFNDGSAFDFDEAVEAVTEAEWTDQVITPMVEKAYGTGLDTTQPTRVDDGLEDDYDADVDAEMVDLQAELLSLIVDNTDDPDTEENPDGKADGLRYCDTDPCPAGRTAEVVKAVCTAVLSSAPATMK